MLSFLPNTKADDRRASSSFGVSCLITRRVMIASPCITRWSTCPTQRRCLKQLEPISNRMAQFLSGCLSCRTRFGRNMVQTGRRSIHRGTFISSLRMVLRSSQGAQALGLSRKVPTHSDGRLHGVKPGRAIYPILPSTAPPTLYRSRNRKSLLSNSKPKR